MKQLDWAERKVNAVWKRHGGLLSGDDMVAMLRAERARAKRACRKVKCKAPFGYGFKEAQGYNQACDDCAAAIRKP